MLNSIASYITGVITGLGNSNLNLYELEEWFNTYNSILNIIHLAMISVAVVIPTIILCKIVYKIMGLNEEAQA